MRRSICVGFLIGVLVTASDREVAGQLNTQPAPCGPSVGTLGNFNWVVGPVQPNGTHDVVCFWTQPWSCTGGNSTPCNVCFAIVLQELFVDGNKTVWGPIWANCQNQTASCVSYPTYSSGNLDTGYQSSGVYRWVVAMYAGSCNNRGSSWVYPPFSFTI